MAITVNKVSEKNTKSQILIEHEKALKLIEMLKGANPAKSSPKATTTTTKVVDKSINIEGLIQYFNIFSNNLKDDMSRENSVIEELKEKIELKKDTIQNIYSISSDASIDELISTYTNLLEEQDTNLDFQENKSLEEVEVIVGNFEEEKEEKTLLQKRKKAEFNLYSIRTNKEDVYNKEKSIDKLEKEREEHTLENEKQIDDLKENYSITWSELYKALEEDKDLQNTTIEKAKELKEKLEENVSAKVSNIVGRQKGNNTQEFRNIEQEYENKITLKQTKLENLEQEESILNTQIAELQSELAIVQEKAHILATKTIESKSATHSFQAMKDIAMEQAKGKK